MHATHAGTPMDGNELLMTAGRATAVYRLMLVVVRALGERTVGNGRIISCR
jgi:hypothetical protein